MDKVTYATDTTAEVPGASLSAARYWLAATGNSTHGYFGGGRGLPAAPPTFTTRMDKVTYSSDTAAAAPGASLSAARYLNAATGNSTHGYFGGGAEGPPISPVATMNKVTYSSDTISTVAGAALSVASRGVAATGNSTNGYFGGGLTPGGAASTMNKVTYSSDTTAAVPGAALSDARYFFAATGNSTAGYFGGAIPTASTMDKIDYATDTRLSAIPGANLSLARFGVGASSPRANALPTTASTPAPVIV
jgi:hypothetical protein